MLKKVSQQIVGIKKKISDIYENKERFEIEKGEGSNNPHFKAALLRRRKEVDDHMVGFRDVEDSLLKNLTEGSTARNIISIVGMGGLGKTTLAKSLHNHSIIENHFQYRAWVTVSEDYNTRQVVLDILNKVVFDVDGLNIQNTDKLKEKLRERLKNNKYIVFLDDVWDRDMWDEVKACFPDNNNGSRILITTRKADVARYASSPREPHSLRYLKDEEGWELFEKKVFQGDPCPPHLKLVGVRIVERCKGLPLSIVVIASMLACQERSQRMWERTLMDVGAQLSKDEVCLDILALSYHNLPVLLKPCILYFAALPEDHEMSVKRLLALWLAEGFIQPLRDLCLDDVAESYLDDLINRSLVQSGKRSADGRLKTCRIHDLVRDLCIREAKRENFLWEASRINNPASSSITKRRPQRLFVHRHTNPYSSI